MTDQGQAAEALSNREQEVAAAYAAGQSYKEIARELGLAPTTVRSHLRTIYGKLGVTSKIELARFLNDASVPEEARDTTTLVADLALELDEAVRRERGLAKILKIISKQENQLEPVIDTVLDHALEICEAEFGILFEFHGDMRYRELQSRGISTAFEAWLKEQGVFPVEPETGLGRVASSLQTVNIADVRGEDIYQSQAPLRIATADLGKARSFAAIPMMSGDRLIGAFTVYRTRVHPFNERALELAQVFADQAVIAIENARQFRELQTRLERTAATREILQVISQSRDDDTPVFEAIVSNVGRLCDAANVALHLADQARTHATYVAGWGDHTKYFEIGVSKWPLDDPLPLTDAIRESRVINIPDSADDLLLSESHPDRVEFVKKDGIRSQLLVPLLVDGQGIGCFEIYRREVKSFSDDEVALVESFAAQAVIAIENVRQFRELQMRLERQAATREVLEAISGSRDDEGPVFDAILSNAQRLCGAPFGNLNMMTEDGTQLEIMADGTEPFEPFRPGWRWPMDSKLLVARSVRETAVLQLEDAALDPLYKQGDEDRVTVVKAGVRTVLTVPLVSGGIGIGSIGLYRRELRPFTSDEIALVQTFAEQAVIAIENVRQFKALEARTQEVQALNASLEGRVEEQVGEIERMGRLKRFLSPQVADAVVSSGDKKILSSHRALIATLFCDIRGFTAFCETAEPEETIEVLQLYHEEMGKLISAHGGGVDKRMGDGIMVIFNDPLPCEDPAGDAVRLAVAMRERMVELCRKWKRLGHRLGFGVGISFGYATIGMVGSEGRYDYTASGTSVNLAARLCDCAEDGEILLSPRAYTAIEDNFRAESSGEVSLKGIREPVEVFKLADIVSVGAQE